MKSFAERLSGRAKQKKKVIVVPQGTVDSEEGNVLKVPQYLKNVSTLIARSTDRGIVAQALPSFDDQYSPPRSRRQKGLRASLACQEDSESDTEGQDPNCLKAGASCSKGDYSETEDQKSGARAAIMPITSSPAKRQPPPLECDISAIQADVPGTRYCSPQKCMRPRSKSAQKELSSGRRESPPSRRALSGQRDVASSTRRERPKAQSYDYGRPSNRTNVLSTSLPERNQTYPPARPRTSAAGRADASYGMRRAEGQSQLGQSRRFKCRPDQSSSYYDESSDFAGSYDPFAVLSSDPYSEYSSSGYVPPCRTPIDLRASTTQQSYQYQESQVAAQSCPCSFGSGREMNAMVAYHSAPPQLFPAGNSFGPPSGFTENSYSMAPIFAQRTRERFAIYEDSNSSPGMGSPCGMCPPLANRTPPPALMYQPPAGNMSCSGPCNASGNTTYYSALSSDPSSYYSAISSSCCCNHGNSNSLNQNSSCCGGNRGNSSCCGGNRGNSSCCGGNRGNSSCCGGNRGNSNSFGGQQAMFPPMYRAEGGPPCGCGK